MIYILFICLINYTKTARIRQEKAVNVLHSPLYSHSPESHKAHSERCCKWSPKPRACPDFGSLHSKKQDVMSQNNTPCTRYPQKKHHYPFLLFSIRKSAISFISNVDCFTPIALHICTIHGCFNLACSISSLQYKI